MLLLLRLLLNSGSNLTDVYRLNGRRRSKLMQLLLLLLLLLLRLLLLLQLLLRLLMNLLRLYISTILSRLLPQHEPIGYLFDGFLSRRIRIGRSIISWKTERAEEIVIMCRTSIRCLQYIEKIHNGGCIWDNIDNLIQYVVKIRIWVGYVIVIMFQHIPRYIAGHLIRTQRRIVYTLLLIRR